MERIRVGTMTNSHGLRGECKVFVESGEPERFASYETFYFEGEDRPLHLESMRVFKNLLIVKFREVDDIEGVLPYKGKGIYVDEADLPELPEGEHYVYRLVGMQVETADGPVGVLKEVMATASNDVYVVALPDGRSAMIPAVEVFIKRVDTENNVMLVELIEGMIE
jgi:16S rRNA processing protein RimM